MTTTPQDAAFKPSLTKTESKADAVDRIARSMIEDEVKKRDAKTARLRQARLDRDAAAKPASASRKAARKAKSID